ncbi:MAG TPA: hypothetical protein VFM49_22420 [Chloroflexia bacterium]|nr:hypothetical protein [Chloroflexia bacterium]
MAPHTSLLNERTRAIKRLQKVLEDANIKRGSVLSDGLGVSGRAMIAGRLAAEPEPAALAA